jgi:signal transduction histidine kinase
MDMDFSSLVDRGRNWDIFGARRLAEGQAAMKRRAEFEEPLRYDLMRQIRWLWMALMVMEAFLLRRAGIKWGDWSLAMLLPTFFLVLSFNPVKPVARAFAFTGMALSATLVSDTVSYPQYGGVLVITIILAGLLVGEFFVGVWAFICCVPLAFAMSKNQPWTTTAGWALVFAGAGWLVILFSRHLERLLDRTITAEEQQRNAIVTERTRFAREIHDTLAQGFTGIMMQLNAASQRLDSDASQARSHLDKARELAQTSLDEARRSVAALRMGVLTNSTLFEAIEQIGNELAANSKARLETHLEGVPQPLPDGYEAHLLRIAQEALTNAIRHSAADRISVRVAYQPSSVVLEIEDNGQGGAQIGAPGHGLDGMRERARQIGGQIDIRSQPGQGTRVVIIVPNA